VSSLFSLRRERHWSSIPTLRYLWKQSVLFCTFEKFSQHNVKEYTSPPLHFAPLLGGWIPRVPSRDKQVTVTVRICFILPILYTVYMCGRNFWRRSSSRRLIPRVLWKHGLLQRLNVQLGLCVFRELSFSVQQGMGQLSSNGGLLQMDYCPLKRALIAPFFLSRCSRVLFFLLSHFCRNCLFSALYN
jgi:hypothetical protein